MASRHVQPRLLTPQCQHLGRRYQPRMTLLSLNHLKLHMCLHTKIQVCCTLYAQRAGREHRYTRFGAIDRLMPRLHSHQPTAYRPSADGGDTSAAQVHTASSPQAHCANCTQPATQTAFPTRLAGNAWMQQKALNAVNTAHPSHITHPCWTTANCKLLERILHPTQARVRQLPQAAAALTTQD